MAKKRAAKKAARKAAKKTARTTRKAAARPSVKRVASRVGKKAAAKRATKKARPHVKRTRPAARKPTGPARNVAVVVGDADRSQIQKVASQLKSRGMKIDSVLHETGIITGTYGRKPASLSRVKGVTAVEETAPIQLPPPESDIQ